MANLKEEVAALRKIAADQAAKIEALQPLEGILSAALKTIDELNATIADQKKELGALRGQVNQFKGKLPVDEEELKEVIKSTIDEAFKDVKIAMPAAGAATAAGAAEEAMAEEPAAEEEAAAPADEFGLGPSTAADEFGF